jgi:hypothetical protein
MSSLKKETSDNAGRCKTCVDCINFIRRKKNMQDKTGKKEEQKNCEREGIFWLSKCSVCGSENISVTFKPEFEYTYYKGNESIGFHCKYKSIEIKCKDCNYCQGTSNSSLIQFIS